jgi:hypothetical protein
VDHLLLVDQVRGLVDRAHERIQIVTPVVEYLVDVLLVLEGHNAGEAIDLAADRFVHDQVGEELLSLVQGQVEQLGHAFRVDSRVVLGHHAHILNT